MKREDLLEFWKGVKQKGNEKAPRILSGLAILGVIWTAREAYKAGPICDRVLAEKKKDWKDIDPDDKNTKKIIIKEGIKEMSPSVARVLLAGGFTIGCIAGSDHISNKRILIFSTAYSMKDMTLKELEGKVKETLGERKTEKLKNSIREDRVKKSGKKVSAKGLAPEYHPCLDEFSGQVFYTTYTKAEQAITEVSRLVMSYGFASVNDLLQQFDGSYSIPIGEDVGWKPDDLVEGRIPIVVTSTLNDEGDPCLYLSYDWGFRNGYLDNHRYYD